MKTLTLSDGGHTYQLRIREDVELPSLPTREEPAHMKFLSFWSMECQRMGIPSTRNAIDIRLAKSLLKKYSVEELSHQARGCLLDFGEEVRQQKYESGLIILAMKLKQAGGDLLSNEPS